MEIDAGKRFVGFHGCVSVTTLSHFGIIRTSPVENVYIVVGLDFERGDLLQCRVRFTKKRPI